MTPVKNTIDAPGDTVAGVRALHIDRSRRSRPSDGKRKWLSVSVLAIGFISIVAVLVAWWQRGGGIGRPVIEVQVAEATRRNLTGPQSILTAGGYVIARNQVEVGSKIAGRVVALEAREGDVVRKGQVIARLDNYEVTAQVNQAQASVAAAKARLAELEAGSRPQEIDRSRAETDRAQADLKNAELALTRAQSLVKDGVLHQQALDDARTRYEMALNAYRAAEESHELAKIGPRQEQIELARAQLRQSAAELAYAQSLFENTIIRAPISGTILDRYVDLGAMVTTGFTSTRGAKQALVALADVNDLQVELDISEADIAKVKLTQPAAMVPDAYRDRCYKAACEYIAAVADRQKATIKVKVKVINPDEYLRPDMGAKVTFYQIGDTLPPRAPGVFVPKSALVPQGGSFVVFVVKDSKAAAQMVSKGKEDSGYVEILAGLQGGETVITSHGSSIRDGDQITVKK